MSSNEEVKVIKDMPRTAIIEKDGKQYWVCKKCNQLFESEREWRAHLPKCTKEASENEVDEEVDEEVPTGDVYTEDYNLTPEERMLLEMKATLKRMLYSTPGVKDKKTVEWFCEQYFTSIPVLSEDPNELFRAIQRHFPKVPDDAIMLIVRSVFDVRSKYVPSSNVFIYPPQQNMKLAQPIQMYTGNNPDMFTMMMQMIQMIQSMNRPTRETDISRLIEAEVERRLLKEEVKALREQIQSLVQAVSRPMPSVDGWSDDYARLINNLGEKILDLGSEILKENRKIRRAILSAIAKGTKHKPIGSGKTDDEVVEALLDAGLEVLD